MGSRYVNYATGVTGIMRPGRLAMRLLALDGVAPTQETIRDGSYPISDSFFAITAAPIGAPDPRESNPNLNAFLDWILSEQGQQIVEDSGYVSIR